MKIFGTFLEGGLRKFLQFFLGGRAPKICYFGKLDPAYWIKKGQPLPILAPLHIRGGYKGRAIGFNRWKCPTSR